MPLEYSDVNDIQYHIEDFEGPLDLMLALVQKNKMNIYDIEIVTLIDQYLTVVGGISPEAMESASEFITMAARLVQIKSIMLLPRSEESDKAQEELTGLLVEYSACKEIAGQLRLMGEGIFIAVRAAQSYEPDYTYQGKHHCNELLDAVKTMSARKSGDQLPQREHFDDIVATPVVAVENKAVSLMLSLARKRVTHLREILGGTQNRSETVAIFLALLELISGGRIELDNDGQLYLCHKDNHRSQAERNR